MTFQLPPHIEALRYMMLIGMTNNDGKDIIPELVAEIMSYCGKPTLRLDGLREEILLHRDNGCSAGSCCFCDDGVIYGCSAIYGARCEGFNLRKDDGTEVTIKKTFLRAPCIKSLCYDPECRTLFIGYETHGSIYLQLIVYDMKTQRITHDIEDTPIEWRCFSAMAYSKGFLYVAKATSASTEIFFMELSDKSKEFKVAHRISDAGVESMSLHAVPKCRYEVMIQYRVAGGWKQEFLRIARSDPFIKFEAIGRLLTETVTGSLYPVIGDATLYLNKFDDDKICCLRTKIGLKKVADFDLGGKSLPSNNIVLHARWILSYYSAGYLIRVNPYVDE